MTMVLVSKQHKVTTKYKMQAKNAFLPYLSVGRNIVQKCSASRFCCRASGFLSHLPCRMSSCGNNF